MKSFWAKITAFFMAIVAFFTGLFAGGNEPVDPQPEPTTEVVVVTTEPATDPTTPTEPSTEPVTDPTTPALPDIEALLLEDGPKNTMNVNAIHQLKSVTDTICDSYIITTEDGKVIVIDGGYKAETSYFLSYLQTVTGQEQPHIDMWFLTHPHYDHMQIFYEVIENQPDALTFDKVCLKFPPVGFFNESVAPEASEAVREYVRLHALFAEKEQIPNDGDRFSVGAAEITMLFTFDPDMQAAITNPNETSLVFRMDLGGRSVLFTGDAATYTGRKILNDPAAAALLDCEICKMAHHGQNAVERSFYEAVTPEICLWPTPSWLWTNLNGTGPYTTLDTRQWIQDLGVKRNIVATDGSKVLYLNRTANS